MNLSTDIRDGETIRDLFDAAVRDHADRPFLAVPANPRRAYAPAGREISYGEAGRQVQRLRDAYRRAGYGVGHRVALLLENRPEHVLHKLALNAIGVCCVPVNPDYRAGETAYLLDHSRPDLVLTIGSRRAQVAEALAEARHRPAVLTEEEAGTGLPPPLHAARHADPSPDTPASILYTSGTTGRPKGCILSHGYEVASGAWYAAIGGMAAIRPGEDRIYNPLPLYHVNSSVVSLFCAIATGNCQIQTDRFHPERWWPEVGQTRATVVHHLGVIVSMLLARPATPEDHDHCVRFGLGAGVEPQMHAAFEARFGFPLIEIWGMTETVRLLADSTENRQVGTRAIGCGVPGIDVRVVDDADRDVADGSPGEMLVRHSAATPRRGSFSGYLDDDEATETAWRGGWFHTGDTVWRGADGVLHFVDRKKNIIRRSGENIAAAEIEALLLSHPDVLQAAVLAVRDETREEEVLACVVLKSGTTDERSARDLFAYCNERVAYYKAPGWIHILPALPTTGTQKIQKHTIYPNGTDPREAPGIFDLRALKRRGRGNG
ncbi:MAG: AMP-binding protein [Betaproteobacteria bacterium]|nr:AMP-binding protein [Betaproteobacteria bacterium]